MVERWQGAVGFVAVYLEEAHAEDEWPIAQLDTPIPQHRTLKD
eukprot:gene121-11003_t